MSRELLCRHCNRTLAVGNFFPSWISETGTASTCRECASARGKAWEKAHPEYRKSERSKAIQKKWRIENREYLKSCVYQWRKDHPGECAEIAKRYRRNNMDKVLFRNRQREILEKTAMPPWANRGKIQEIYATAKRLTRETGIRHEVDHIYPLRGKFAWGLHVEGNLRIITGSENRKKLNKMPEECA